MRIKYRPKEYKESYSIDDALELARIHKYGPMVKNQDPTPSVKEAIQIISEAQKTMNFNWITGSTALKVLKGTS